MFSKGLEDLIQATLEDGILEDYEKAALVKRAQAEGVDLTELEIYINSILQKRKKEHDKVEDAKMEKIEQEKNKALRKCPNCGASMPVLAIVCPQCGYELSDQKAISSVSSLSNKIEKISSRHISTGLFSNPEKQKNQINAKIIETINLFSVPNTKEDLIEFLALAASNSHGKGGLFGTNTRRGMVLIIVVLVIMGVGTFIGYDQGDYLEGLGWSALVALCIGVYGGLYAFLSNQDVVRENKVAKAWRDKFKQVMLKARVMRGDKEFSNQLDYFEKMVK